MDGSDTMLGGGKTSTKLTRPGVGNASGVMKKRAYVAPKGPVQNEEIDILAHMMSSFGMSDAAKKPKAKKTKDERMSDVAVRRSERVISKPVPMQNEPMSTVASTKSKTQKKEVVKDTADYYEDIMLSKNPHVSIEERIAAGEALKAMREEEFSEMVQRAEQEMMRIDIELNGLKNRLMAGGKKKRAARK